MSNRVTLTAAALFLVVIAARTAEAGPGGRSGCAAKKLSSRPACCDTRDNDRDGLIDYPDDPGCSKKRDNKEKNSPSTGNPGGSDPDGGTPGGNGETGAGARLGSFRSFPDDNAWNLDVSGAPVDPNSDALLASIGLETGLHPDFGTVYEGRPIGIPYTVVTGSQAKVPVTFDYADESDPGPYPIPPDAPVEGGSDASGDRHVLVIDRDNLLLYELFDAHKQGNGWRAGSGALFDLRSNSLRPAGWTSADAAGLPIFPGLVRYEEIVELGELRHAVRFTVSRSRRAYVSPARHFASSNTDPNLPPMGMRVRLKSSVDISRYPLTVQVILRGLKKYGMMVADNGSNWYVSGAPDSRWNDDELASLRGIKGKDFEVVRMEGVVTE